MAVLYSKRIREPLIQTQIVDSWLNTIRSQAGDDFSGVPGGNSEKVGRVWYDKKVGSQRVAVSCIGGSSFFVVPASRRSGDGVSGDHRHGGTDQRAIRAGDAFGDAPGILLGEDFVISATKPTFTATRMPPVRNGTDGDGERGHP